MFLTENEPECLSSTLLRHNWNSQGPEQGNEQNGAEKAVGS
jgi:hypothetical protein